MTRLSTPMTMTPTMIADEPTLSLPTVPVVAAVLGGSAASAGGWWAVTAMLGSDQATLVAGLAGAAVVGVVGVVAVLVLAPWRSRPVSFWWTLWLAGTVLRLLATPAVTFLLYSATSLSAVPLTLSVAVTYLVALFAETAVIARHVNRVLASPASSSRDQAGSPPGVGA